MDISRARTSHEYIDLSGDVPQYSYHLLALKVRYPAECLKNYDSLLVI